MRRARRSVIAACIAAACLVGCSSASTFPRAAAPIASSMATAQSALLSAQDLPSAWISYPTTNDLVGVSGWCGRPLAFKTFPPQALLRLAWWNGDRQNFKFVDDTVAVYADARSAQRVRNQVVSDRTLCTHFSTPSGDVSFTTLADFPKLGDSSVALSVSYPKRQAIDIIGVVTGRVITQIDTVGLTRSEDEKYARAAVQKATAASRGNA
jgi:hypothetical protein